MNFKISGNQDGSLNVTTSPYVQTQHASTPMRGTNVFWKFDTTSTSFSATLNFTFNSSMLASWGYSASSLKFAYYDALTDTWAAQGGVVDQVMNVVYYTTNHFSEWTVVSSSSSSSTITPAIFITLCLLFISIVNSLL